MSEERTGLPGQADTFPLLSGANRCTVSLSPYHRAFYVLKGGATANRHLNINVKDDLYSDIKAGS